MGLEAGELVGVVVGGVLGGLLLLVVLLVLLRAWMQGGKCKSNARLEGKTVVITGCNTGIGKITAMDLSKRGAKIVMLCRSLDKAESAADDIRKATEGEVVVHKMDLASLDSISECADQLLNSLTKVDILINNAGVMMCPFTKTEDGFEMQIGTNHFGHFYLTYLLMPLLKKAAPGARVVNVSSLAHESGAMQWEDINYENTPYDALKAYSQSKLANILFTKELARRGEGTGVHAYALHPGVVATELGRHMGDTFGCLGSCMMSCVRPVLKTPEHGAQTTIYCAVDQGIADHNGRYYSDCKEKTPKPQALSAEDARRLWDLSEQLTGVGHGQPSDGQAGEHGSQ